MIKNENANITDKMRINFFREARLPSFHFYEYCIAVFFSFYFIMPSYGAVSLSGMTGMSLGENVTANVEGNKMIFTQTSQTAVVDHETLNLREHEHFEHQYKVANNPVINERYVILHRVTGGESSTLDGRISAIGKGEVWFSNPSGIVFGKNAQVVNVAGLLATTGEIYADHFKRNIEKNSSLEWNVRSSEPITIEKGAQIKVNDNGYACFAGQKIHDHGVIIGRFSKIELQSGSAFVFNIDEEGTIGFHIKKGSANAKLVHDGAISAPGGAIYVGAETTIGTTGEVMRIEGLIQADTLGEKTGEIEVALRGSISAKMNLNGAIEAVGKEGGEQGGKVDIKGSDLRAENRSVIDVSGQGGGGAISIGVGEEGNRIFLQDTSRLFANGFVLSEQGEKVGEGKGGRVLVYSDKRADLYGEVAVNGGGKSSAGYIDFKAENAELDFKGKIEIHGGVDSNSPGESGIVKMTAKVLNYFGEVFGEGGEIVNLEDGVRNTISSITLTARRRVSTHIGSLPGVFSLFSEDGSEVGRVLFDAPTVELCSIGQSDVRFEFNTQNTRNIYGNLYYLQEQGIEGMENVELQPRCTRVFDYSYYDYVKWAVEFSVPAVLTYAILRYLR